MNLKQGFPKNKIKGYAWSPLKGHAYLNKPAHERCKFAYGVLARNSKLRPFGPHWENLEAAPVKISDLNKEQKCISQCKPYKECRLFRMFEVQGMIKEEYSQINDQLACVPTKNI